MTHTSSKPESRVLAMGHNRPLIRWHVMDRTASCRRTPSDWRVRIIIETGVSDQPVNELNRTWSVRVEGLDW